MLTLGCHATYLSFGWPFNFLCNVAWGFAMLCRRVNEMWQTDCYPILSTPNVFLWIFISYCLLSWYNMSLNNLCPKSKIKTKCHHVPIKSNSDQIQMFKIYKTNKCCLYFDTLPVIYSMNLKISPWIHHNTTQLSGFDVTEIMCRHLGK